MRARLAGRWNLVCLFLLLSACGGGGGGEPPPTNPNTPPPTSNEPPPTGNEPPPSSPPPPAGDGATFTLSTDSLTFETANLNSIPATQTITATVPADLSGTLYFIVQVTGTAVISVDDFTITSSTSGRATVYPQFASKLGAGTHTSTITVTACTNDPTCATGQLPGSPRTVNVTYLASSTVQGDIVMPRVITANQPGETIIRGRGFNAVTSVQFGTNAAVEFTVVSDSEIHAEYGSLPVGTYPVVLNSGSVPFNATLVATDIPTYASATLTYPSPATTQAIGGMIYDAQRKALFVVARQTQSANNQLLRFDYENGSWSAPAVATVANLRSVALLPDGESLLVATDTALTEVNPDTLALGSSYAPTANLFSTYLNALAVANDGYIIVTTDINGSGNTDLFLYSTATHAFYRSDLMLSRGGPGASADGSFVALQEGGTPAYLQQYSASTQIHSQTDTDFGSAGNPRTARPSVDRAATRIVLLSNPYTRVYDRNYQLLGTLPNETRAAVLNPDGSRAYAYIHDTTSSELCVFDLTAGPTGVAYPQVGSSIPVDPGYSTSYPVVMTISQDGGAIFVAGHTQIEVRPAPP